MIFLTANTFAMAQYWIRQRLRDGSIESPREVRIVLTETSIRGLTIYEDDTLVDLRVAGPGQYYNARVTEPLRMALLWGQGRFRNPAQPAQP